MEVIIEGIKVNKVSVFDIPVIYIEPKIIKEKRIAIFLGGLGSTKETLVSYLNDIAKKGYIAIAFDNYGHGERGTETRNEIFTRVFGNMRKHGWRILGETVKDAAKVIDWAIDYFKALPDIRMGGISMGGDISIALSGLDKRITKVLTIVSTPDWLRPGMHEIVRPDVLMDPGNPDEISQSLYDEFNPMTHLERYLNGPKIRAILGEKDNHIPPENFEGFKRELSILSVEASNNIDLIYITGDNSNHIDTIKRRDEWWESSLEWWLS